MTGSRVNGGTHIDDGDLIRLLDGECPSGKAEQIRAHIDICPECRDNIDTLKHASEQFSSWLTELETSAPLEVVQGSASSQKPAGRDAWLRLGSPRVLRAAAVLAAMVLVFAATPAHAWLVLGWEALKSLVIAETSESPAEIEVPVIAGPEMSSVIRFTLRGSEFRLEFTNRPESGTLVLLFDSVTTASAGVFDGDGVDEMILLPDGLRIRNAASSTVSYEVRLPLTLSLVEVRIAGRTELRLDGQSLSAPLRRELDLSGKTGH